MASPGLDNRVPSVAFSRLFLIPERAGLLGTKSLCALPERGILRLSVKLIALLVQGIPARRVE
jgi:hypothetical protein